MLEGCTDPVAVGTSTAECSEDLREVRSLLKIILWCQCRLGGLMKH